MVPAYIPSPSEGVIHLGPLPIRAYAICIICGVIAAAKIAEPRAVARGIRPMAVADVALWAVPIALVGARIYNVITTPQPYFGRDGDPVRIFEVWKGGLGIWGGVLFGVTAGWIWCRRNGIDPLKMADAIAPGIAVGQAVGRLGNYFNQELFGKPTTLPWGLEIAPGHDGTVPGAVAYQPTFLYELLWDLGTAGVCIWAGRRFNLRKGQTMALYGAVYTVGRAWIEYLRTDMANHFLGLRINDYVCIVVFAFSITMFRRFGRRPLDADDLAAAAAHDEGLTAQPGTPATATTTTATTTTTAATTTTATTTTASAASHPTQPDSAVSTPELTP